MGVAAAPLHPLWVGQGGLGFGDAGALEEHDQIMVAVGGAKGRVLTMAAHGASPATRVGGPVHDDRRAGHASQRAPGPLERRIGTMQAPRVVLPPVSS